MKLSKFIAQLNDLCLIENRHNPINEIEVYIATENNSIAYSSAVKVKSLNLGFDWDTGRLFIYPEQPLVLQDLNRDVPMPIIDFNKTYPFLADPTAKRKVYNCPNCEEQVSIKHHYCSKCGQRLEGVK